MNTARGEWLVEDSSSFAILASSNVEVKAVEMARDFAAKRSGVVYISVRGHGSTAYTVRPDGSVIKGHPVA